MSQFKVEDGSVHIDDGVTLTKVAELNTYKTGFSYEGKHYDITGSSASGYLTVAIIGEEDDGKEDTTNSSNEADKEKAPVRRTRTAKKTEEKEDAGKEDETLGDKDGVQ